ncbi:hypothetical protein AZI87_01645 [Bdellovibrio bacteriovorus]|uniref:Uncharacterized protein n=1 Tax=Bdellovibrio bacteriovorus TaxID=959 RepID=A0A162GF73_BDEBC|nr:hypothetical protein AZI87_01645 [Bdellovibrio bacteriovorus]
MKQILALVITLILFGGHSGASAAEPKCEERAKSVILSKGLHRGEKAVLDRIHLFASNQNYEGYHVFVTVNLRSGTSFKQVCEIIMQSSNCSYDDTFGCAASVDDL